MSEAPTDVALARRCAEMLYARDRASQHLGMTIESDGPGRWRIRSWQWRDNAWRPSIARAERTDAGADISGTIDAADRAEVIARLHT